MAKPLGFKMVKQTNLAQVPLQPKQAQIAENRAVAISPADTDMNIPLKTVAKSSRGRNTCEPGQYVS